MKVVIQRVSEARVAVDSQIVGQIGKGMLILLGVASADSEEDVDWLIRKCMNMRIFSDTDGKMNESIVDQSGAFLVVSQFTLQANIKKGNRPSFIYAACPVEAEMWYGKFCHQLQAVSGLTVERGVFGADMKVSLLNDGPVTIVMDSKNKT